MTRYSRMFDLSKKVAVITGGTGAIGKALAIGLSEFGCNIAIVDVSRDKEQRVVSEVKKRGRKCVYFSADITDPNSIERVVREVCCGFGGIDILINSAGLNIRKPALEYSEKDWNTILDTNLKGVFLTTQSVGRAMIRQRRGKIINMASVMGLVGSPSYQSIVPYCASKGGVVQLTKSFAVEWAKYHVHVNAIAPSHVRTAMIKPLLKDKERYAAMLSMVPLNRLAWPRDLIGPTVFLASEASDYVTGHILFVDGGWLAR